MRFEPGQMVEVKGLPTRVPTKWDRGGVRMLVDGKWVEASAVWRPAVFADRLLDGLLLFLWTDSRHYAKVHPDRLSTCVRKPQGGTASQEKHLQIWGELC